MVSASNQLCVISLIEDSHDMRSMTSLPDLEMYKAAEEVRAQQATILESAGVENASLYLAFQPIASSAVKACDEKGGNPMGLKAQNHNCKKQQPLVISSCSRKY